MRIRLQGLLELNDRQKWFLKRHLSSAVSFLLFCAIGVISLPVALYSDPREKQVELKGHLSALRIAQNVDGSPPYFYFNIKEQSQTFKVTNLSLGDQALLSSERIGVEVTFSVEADLLDRGDAGIPVLSFASPTNVYIRSGDLALLMRKGRWMGGFFVVVAFSISLLLARRLRYQYQSESPDQPGADFDPIVVAIARRPRFFAGAATAAVWIVLIALVPGKAKAIVSGVLVFGYLAFLWWFRKHRDEISWIKVVLASADRWASERPQTRAPKHVQAVEMLIKSGKDVNICDSQGRTPLHIACESGQVECVDLLLRNGGKTDLQDSLGQTPLMIAAEKGLLGIVTRLLDAKANVLLVDQAGENALARAQHNKKNRGTIEVLTRATNKAIAAEKAKAEAEAEAAKAAAEAALDSAGSGGESSGTDSGTD